MSLLNNAAENAYRRFLEHCKDCPRCARWDQAGSTSVCATGRRLLSLWEVAESNAARVA